MEETTTVMDHEGIGEQQHAIDSRSCVHYVFDWKQAL
jgi:hypothetical protein